MISTRLFNNPIPSFLVAVAVLASGVMVTGCDSGGNGGGGGSETPQDFGTVSTDRTVSVGETVSGDLDPSEDARLLDLAGADDDDPVTDTDRQVIDIYEVSLGAEKDSSKEGSKDGKNVTIRMQQVNDLDPKLYLYEKGGTFVAVDDDGGSGVNAKIDQGLSSGDYYIVASAAEGPEDGEGVGDYELVLGDGTNDDDDNDDGSGGGDEEGDTSSDFSNTSTEGTISVGETSSGALESSDAVLSDIADADTSPQDPATETSSEPIDIYELSLSSEQDVAISMSGASNMLDTELYLYEQGTSGSATFRISDDGGSENSAEIAQMLSSGDYYIVASATSSGATGDYEIEVGQSAATFANTSTEGTIGVGETKSAALESSDAVLSAIADADTTPQDPATETSSEPIDIYTLSLSSEQDVAINMSGVSNMLDTELYLYEQGTSGSVTFRTSDDGGSENSAEIAQTLSSGDYYIVASATSASATGDYELQVSEEGLIFEELQRDADLAVGDFDVSGTLQRTGSSADAQLSRIRGVDSEADIGESFDSRPFDLYRVKSDGGDIAFTMRRAEAADDVRPAVYVYDTEGNFLKESEQRSSTTVTVSPSSFTTDSLYVVAGSQGGKIAGTNQADYKLDVVSSDDFDSVKKTPIDIRTDTTAELKGSDVAFRIISPILDVSKTGRRTGPGLATDLYTFTVDREMEVALSMTVPEESLLDKELSVFKPSGELVTRVGQSLKTATLAQGRYIIVASTSTSQDDVSGTGKYNLQLSRPGIKGVSAGSTISVGDTLTAELTESDKPLDALAKEQGIPSVRRKEVMDVYKLSVESERAVDISMPAEFESSNTTIDPGVGLYKKQNGSTERLDWDLSIDEVSLQNKTLSPDATYFIVTTTRNRPSEVALDTGSYELRVVSSR